MSDDKNKNLLPTCVKFGMRYRETILEKLNKYGKDWMNPNVSHDWLLAGLVFDLLDGLIDDDDEESSNYKLFFLLGYKLIDLVSSVNIALNNFIENKKEN